MCFLQVLAEMKTLFLEKFVQKLDNACIITAADISLFRVCLKKPTWKTKCYNFFVQAYQKV